MFKFIRSKTFLINLAISGLFAVLVIWGIFKFIDSYTLHGETISVPTLEGLTTTEVESILTEKKLRFSILDSIYIAEADKGVVLEQNPSPDDLVKENRTIYITVSKVTPPKVSIPDVKGMSQRLAIAKLESYGFKVKPNYVISEHIGNIVSLKMKGKEVNFNDKVNKGSTVVINVGLGQSNEKVMVPYLIGLTKEEAENKLMESSLSIFVDTTNCNCKTPEDLLLAKVYRQNPIRNENAAINMGSSVDLHFTCDTNLINFNPPVIDSLRTDTVK
ncbi:MAG: hypothetical protein COB15_16380 [Flavobacteriales bacterium]|nr:MAG: hypothetical protein COB15_16380 [Flavobacteriales bacterium]